MKKKFVNIDDYIKLYDEGKSYKKIKTVIESNL